VGAHLWRSRHWASLAAKLSALVKMRGQWGDLHNIYETRGESLYEQQPLPRLIRDPESTFSGYWDFGSVAFLLYVCFATPVRACFGVSILLWRCGRAAPAPATTCCHRHHLLPRKGSAPNEARQAGLCVLRAQ
jgi:hypothetical protein